MDRNSRVDWAGYDPGAIPSKSDLSPLERWLERFPSPEGTRILDLGCGSGEVASMIARRGFSVTGLDLNEKALALAAQVAPQASFLPADAADPAGLPVPDGTFHGVACQLLLSVVGDAQDRLQALRNARSSLRAGGILFASLSGRSDDLNPQYERLYQEDLPLTGEEGTYLSRDGLGNILYRTHHFLTPEVRLLLEEAGFSGIEIEERVETSRRRHDQKARFLYAVARRD